MHKHGRANPKQRQPLSWRQQANTKQTNYTPKNTHMEPKKWIPGKGGFLLETHHFLIFSFQPLVFRGNRLTLTTPTNQHPWWHLSQPSAWWWRGSWVDSIALGLGCHKFQCWCLQCFYRSKHRKSLPQESKGGQIRLSQNSKQECFMGQHQQQHYHAMKQVACPIQRTCKSYNPWTGNISKSVASLSQRFRRMLTALQ